MTDWDAIVREDGAAVWRTARRVLGNDADADECFQETFLAALEFSRRSSVRSWRAVLIRIATSKAIDRLRRRVRSGERAGHGNWERFPHGGPLPVELAESAELSERLRRALLELSPQQAQVFCLACIEGQSHREIAEQIGISVDLVGVTVHRARKKLGAILNRGCEVSR